MRFFDRFRRNKAVPIDQVNSYYDQSKRRSPVVAVLMGILAFVVTLIIIWLLFLGGRWVYRQITKDDNKQSNTSQQADQAKKESEAKNSNNNGSTSSTNTSTPSSGSNNNQSGSSNNTSSTGQSSSTNRTQTTPALGDDTALPHTGDEGL